MKKIILLGTTILCLSCIAQGDSNKQSLADQIRLKFNYDSLGFLSCMNTPAGFYAIKFKVDQNHRFYDFICLNDSLRRLNQLFINAIKKSAFSTVAKKMHNGSYLQLIYFNNLVFCNASRDKNDSLKTSAIDTSVSFSSKYDREVVKILNSQLLSIESSLIALQNSLHDESLVVLSPAIINNANPNSEKERPSFRNDTPSSTITKERLVQIERMINERKKKKKQQSP